MKTSFFWLLIAAVSLFHLNIVALAQSESTNYQIEPLNSATDKNQLDSTNYSLFGSFPPPSQDNSNDAVSTGTSYQQNNDALSISLKPLRVSLGPVKKESFQKAALTIDLSKNTGPVSLFALQIQPLKNLDKTEMVAPTQCNQGLNRCYVRKEAIWDNSKKDGFGYSINNSQINFKKNYFRPFPERVRGENPILIFNSAAAIKKGKTTINYQLSLPAKQKTASYYGIVNYLVIADF